MAVIICCRRGVIFCFLTLWVETKVWPPIAEIAATTQPAKRFSSTPLFSGAHVAQRNGRPVEGRRPGTYYNYWLNAFCNQLNGQTTSNTRHEEHRQHDKKDSFKALLSAGFC